jgi:hypothetical protein
MESIRFGEFSAVNLDRIDTGILVAVGNYFSSKY